jgi:hypothetical protein
VLPSHVAQAWAKHTQIRNILGSTETISSPHLDATNDEYEYIVFSRSWGGLDFRKVTGDTKDKKLPINGTTNGTTNGTSTTSGTPRKNEEPDLYELVYTLNETSAPYATYFARLGITLESSANSPSDREIPSGDLWQPHPDPAKAPIAWKFAGRKDDLVTFSSGVNFHPGPVIRALGSREELGPVVVSGGGRNQAVVLAEVAPAPSSEVGKEKDTQELAGRVWDETIKELNGKLPSHGRVARTHFVVVPSGSFVRTAKGSVARRATEDKFLGRIEEVYRVYGDVLPAAYDRGQA